MHDFNISHQKDFVSIIILILLMSVIYAFALTIKFDRAPIYFHGRMHPLSLQVVNNTVL